MQRAPHRPGLDDGPLLDKGLLDVVDGELSQARPEGNPGHRGHLGLDSADISNDARQPTAGGSEVQMVAVLTQGGNLSVTE